MGLLKEGKDLPDDLTTKLNNSHDKVRRLQEQTTSTPVKTPAPSTSSADSDANADVSQMQDKVQEQHLTCSIF